MKEASNLTTPGISFLQRFADWHAVVQLLEQLSWKPGCGRTIRIFKMESGEWQVQTDGREGETRPGKDAPGYGIGLHDLSW